ncbi:transglycosylase domain-containing protein [Thermosynechococcaceae cyanobacterium BACA0444]|uniref:Transglycosylase domain-containing protein n=2 Tax=Pseudocalidococcus TaxID=3110321 RepID=A0AAE4FSB8_9CYAN|nr:transglycosylase domain-containing protein [Pseudocalidococcus azoricus]MDS3860662.1 transglycosylase domain-containing protein [Pseudocalidococcus azoricus BACA0444]
MTRYAGMTSRFSATPLLKNFTQTVTQALQAAQAQFDWSRIHLKQQAHVPTLEVFDPESGQAQPYPLLGDRYILGRSQTKADIKIDSSIVSGVHAQLTRLGPGSSVFQIEDLDSSNGIFRGRRRIEVGELHDGDTLTLGPPDEARAVQLTFLNPPPLPVKIFIWGLGGTAALVGLGLVWLGVEWIKIPVRPLPAMTQGPVIILSADGKPLAPVEQHPHVELRQLSDYSPYLAKGVMASEDSRYYWHFGVDPIGIFRAGLTNLSGGELREGASTLTQQVARTLYRNYVGSEDSLGRKLREMVVALKLEATYSKDELLLAYLNRVYLGLGNNGFADAARFYFNKPPKELTLAEAATLVGILPAPNSFNPIRDYDAAIDYRNRVISRMAEQGYISVAEADRARRSRIEVSPEAEKALAIQPAAYYTDQVYADLAHLLGKDLAQEGNLIVTTGLNLDWQKRAEKTLKDNLQKWGNSAGIGQGAILTIHPETGLIAALVGGKDYGQSQFNRATQAQRQPGSTFKVILFTAALMRGISLGQTYSCGPFFWQGQQFAGCRHGSGAMDLYRGLALSENPIALRLAQDVGLQRVVDLAHRMGIKSPLQAVPGLVLGQNETTLLEMCSALSVLANQGRYLPPITISRVQDGGDCSNPDDFQTCRIIFERDAQDLGGEPVVPADVAATMTQALTAVVRAGTGRAAAIGLRAAGKTGTTNDYRDLWFIGYVPSRNVLTGVWLGNDNNSPTQGSSGDAAAIWGDFMGQILR